MDCADYIVAYIRTHGYKPTQVAYLIQLEISRYMQGTSEQSQMKRDPLIVLRNLFNSLDKTGQGFLQLRDFELALAAVCPHLDFAPLKIALGNTMGSTSRITFRHFCHVLLPSLQE